MVHRRNSSIVKPSFPRPKMLVSSSSSATPSVSASAMAASLIAPLSISSSQLRGRKLRVRLTVLLILVIISLASYLLCSSTISTYHLWGFSPDPQHRQHEPAIPLRPKLKLRPHKASTHHIHGSVNPPIALNAEEELAAVSAHLAALPQNVIPSFIDPSRRIDPQLVLDFDVRAGKRSEQELKVMVQQTWEHNPVVVYCKHYSPQSRSLRNILSTMDIQPPPTIFELDLRPDSEVLMPLIARVIWEVFVHNTSSRQGSDIPAAADDTPAAADDIAGPISAPNPSSLPALLIGGKLVSAGDVELVRELSESGKLKEMIRDAGAEIKDPKRKKKGRR